MPLSPKLMSSASANVDQKDSQERVAGSQPTRKTSSNTCPSASYLKRVTCPRRQQFYKELQEQETRAEGPRKVYHACSKYLCPRAPRNVEEPPEVRPPESRPEVRPRPKPQKKPTTVREAGDRENEEARKTKLNFVIEKERARPPQKHRAGVAQYASNLKHTVVTHSEIPRPMTTVDEGVQAYCKEATKNSALYNTQEGLGEHLKYGRFANKRRLPQRNIEPTSSRNVFGPAQPQKSILNKELKNGPGPVRTGSIASNSRNKTVHLTRTRVMHVDIKPRAYANSPPLLRRNKSLAQQPKRRRQQNLNTRAFTSSPAFQAPCLVYKQSTLRHPTPISNHASAMRVQSNQIPYTNYRPSYSRVTPVPSYYQNTVPFKQLQTSVPFYGRPMNNEVVRRRSHTTKPRSPHRVLSRRCQSYDKQLACPFSRTRSSQSPDSPKVRSFRRDPKELLSNESIECKPKKAIIKKSQHSITSSVRFQTNLPSASVGTKVSSIHRNVGSSYHNRIVRPQISRRIMSYTTRRDSVLNSAVRQPGRRPTTSMREIPNKNRLLRDTESKRQTNNSPSRSKNVPEPFQSVSVRKRTYNRCLTPTLRRKVLAGEIARPSDKRASNVSVKNSPSRDQSLDKAIPSSPSSEISSDHKFNAMSTQTII